MDLSLYKDEEQLKKRKGTKRKDRSISRKRESSTKKTPDAPKVQKIEVTQTKKVALSIKKLAPAQKKTAPLEVKKVSPLNKTAKGKRKSDPKTSPVVDQKKARVLAKIGRKAAISASKTRSQPVPVKSKYNLT